MFLNAIRAEWLKLSTSKSFWWTSGIAFALVAGLAYLMGWGQQAAYNSALESAKNPPQVPEGIPADAVPQVQVNAADYVIDPSIAVLGFMFAIMVIMIMAVMSVTNEYNSQMIKTTLQAIPNRAVVVATKVLVYGVCAVILSAVSYISAFYIVQIPVKTKELTEGMSLTDGDFQTGLWAMLLYAFLSVVIGVGMGFLVRRTAGALSILLLWKLVVESMVGLIPKVGDKISEWMPFSLMDSWVNRSDPAFVRMPWDNINYNPLYFGAICVAVLIAGSVALYRRDA